MTDRETTPGLAEVIKVAMESFGRAMHVAMPGVVETYDAAEQKAHVKPQVQRLTIDPDGNEELLELPVVPNVPVVFPRGGGCFVSFPLAAGDQVILLVCDRELNTWKSNGGDAQPADPRSHSLPDAVAIPGGYPFSSPLSDAHASNMVMGKDGGAQVHVKGNGEIHIGSENAADAASKASIVDSRLDALESFAGTHVHTGVTPGGGSSGVAAGAPSGSSTASTVVLID